MFIAYHEGRFFIPILSHKSDSSRTKFCPSDHYFSFFPLVDITYKISMCQICIRNLSVQANIEGSSNEVIHPSFVSYTCPIEWICCIHDLHKER